MLWTFMFIPLWRLMGSLKRWAQQKRELFHTLATFDIRNAGCTVEDDRAFVYSEVCQVMRQTKVVGDAASDEDCLDAFNNCVRTEIRGMVEQKIGRGSIPYKKLVVTGTPIIWYGL